jgi:hypothetical protein
MSQIMIIPVPKDTFYCQEMNYGSCNNECNMNQATYPHGTCQCCFNCPSLQACKAIGADCCNLPKEVKEL